MSPALDPMDPNCSLLSELFEIKMQLPHFFTISEAASGVSFISLERSEPSMQTMLVLSDAFRATDASIDIALNSRKSALAEPAMSWSHTAAKILLALVTATASIA